MHVLARVRLQRPVGDAPRGPWALTHRPLSSSSTATWCWRVCVQAEGVEYVVGEFPMIANSRAKSNMDTEGVIKVLADKKTDQMLGCHMINAVSK